MWSDCFSSDRFVPCPRSVAATDRSAPVAGRGRDCLDALAPAVRGCIARFGPASTFAALVSLLVAEAVQARQPAPVARMLLHNAHYLEACALRSETSPQAPQNKGREEKEDGEAERK